MVKSTQQTWLHIFEVCCNSQFWTKSAVFRLFSLIYLWQIIFMPIIQECLHHLLMWVVFLICNNSIWTVGQDACVVRNCMIYEWATETGSQKKQRTSIMTDSLVSIHIWKLYTLLGDVAPRVFIANIQVFYAMLHGLLRAHRSVQLLRFFFFFRSADVKSWGASYIQMHLYTVVFWIQPIRTVPHMHYFYDC